MVEDEVNQLGDQDADNAPDATAPPAHAHELTAQNVRRYPELFTAEEKAQFGYEASDDVPSDEASDDGSTHVTA